MAHDCSGHVPTLPVRLREPVAEVDLLAVHAEALVEAADLVERRSAYQHEPPEHPVGFDRLGRALVELIVVALAFERRERPPERRAPDERAADGREETARRLPRAVGVEHLRAGGATARMRAGKVAEHGDGV